MSAVSVENSGPATKAVQIERLQGQIEHFLRANEKAERAFEVLTRRVEELKAELDDSNRKLRDKITELNHLSGHLIGILHSMSDGVIALDTSGVVRFFSPAAETLTGQRASSVIGTSFESFASFAPGLLRNVRTALDGRAGLPRLRVDWPGDADARPLSIAVAPVYEQPGSIIGAVVVLQDLTEVTSLQKRIFHVEKLAALGQMAAVVAHEIRNPLGGIEGYAMMLQSDLQYQPEQRRYADMIVEGMQSLNGLVNSLLTYSRPVDLRCENVELTTLLQRLWEMAKADPNFSRKAFRMEFESDAAVTRVNADAGALRQVFTNLIRNALEAMAPLGGGELRIRIRDTQTDAREALAVEIADTGPGIPEKTRKNLFQPFMTTKHNGTGLGLPTSAKLIEAHGGELTCTPEPGTGACFRVVLPKNNEAAD